MCRSRSGQFIAIVTCPAYLDPDQLFNLDQVPGEVRDLTGDPAYADVLAMMQRRL